MQDAQEPTRPVRDCQTPIVIGAGTGGPQALMQILPRIASSFSGTFIVVQQMGPGITRILAEQLNDNCKLPAYEPEDGQSLNASEILVVPGGMTLTLSEGNKSVRSIIKLQDTHANAERASIRTNETMASVAARYGRNAIGVLLTGMGEDGREGMRAIVDAGGYTIAQNEESCIVFDLPSSAIDANVAHEELPLWNIADRIDSFISGGANANVA